MPLRDEKITGARIEKLHPKLRAEVRALFEKIEAGFTPNISIRLAQGLRTFQEQRDLYAQGRTKPGSKVTWVNAGYSYHNYGVAIDFVLLYDLDGNGTYETASWDLKKDLDKDKLADWMEVVAIFKAAGWAWGGDWKSSKDYPHFEKSFGLSATQMLNKLNKKETDAQGYIKL